MKFLLIDDEQRLLDALAAALRLRWPDARVLTATRAESGVQLALQAQPDLVLLDVRLPDQNGLEVLRRIRQSSQVPLIFLTALSDEVNHVEGLELGADDYLVKRIGTRALLAHIQAVLRRAQRRSLSRDVCELSVGVVRLDEQRCEVLVGGRRIRLSAVEFRLLYHLLRDAGHPVRRSELIRRVWGGEAAASDHALSVLVARVRAKLAPIPNLPLIVTYRGVGYRCVTS
jgi:DNA-binding response OmpR family regulator